MQMGEAVHSALTPLSTATSAAQALSQAGRDDTTSQGPREHQPAPSFCTGLSSVSGFPGVTWLLQQKVVEPALGQEAVTRSQVPWPSLFSLSPELFCQHRGSEGKGF